MRKSWLLVLAAFVLLISTAIILYVIQNNDSHVDAPEVNQTQQIQNDQNSTTVQQQTYPVQVFFSKHPESDDDPSKTFPVNRVSPDIGVAKYSITELLIGPTNDEISKGYFTYVRLRDEVSNCNGNDFTLSIKDSAATLQFCKTFDHIGSVSDGQAESNIKATLKQFPTITKVIILNKNCDCEFNLSGLNLCLQ